MKNHWFRKWDILLLVTLIGLWGCKPEKERAVTPSFYYWRSVWSPSPAEWKTLQDLEIRKLYLKYFDVDWDEKKLQAIPRVSLVAKAKVPHSLEIIPTVYIVNRTLLALPDSLTAELANKMLHKIEQTTLRLDNPTVREIQLDCDWTERTRNRYFSLLQHMRQQLAIRGIRLSATIRLHQVKYFHRTGVPPVDRGMLMFYNMDKLGDARTRNSIFDPKVAKDYLYNFDQYPLPLDIALPLFSWAVQIRQNRVIALLNELQPADIRNDKRFQPLENNTFLTLERVVRKEQLFLKGDVIRFEEIDSNLCLQAARMINPYLKEDTLRVVLYHLNEFTLQQYESNDLEQIYSTFR